MILEKIKFLYIYKTYMGVIYTVIVSSKYFCGKTLEDPSQTVIQNQLLLRKLRQKIYGILLFEKPEDRVVYEYFKCRSETSREPFKVVPIFPKSKHSGLIAYWSQESKYDDEKWALFSEALEIEITKLKSFEPHLIVPIASINYLLKEGLELNDLELNSLIASIVLPKYVTVDNLSALPDITLTARAITIYTAVTKTFFTVLWLNHSLGFPLDNEMASSINYQEGKLFHYQMKKAFLPCAYPKKFQLSQLEKDKVENTILEIKEFLRRSAE